MVVKKGIILLLGLFCIFFLTCASNETVEAQDKEVLDTDILGFGFLKRIPGLWNGPVFSDTPAGSFAMWYVDFRPVSPAQVSQYSTLDTQTLNYISFFIVKHDNQLKIAMRTEGVFQNKGCITYEVLDTARESEGYYRFSDFQSGTKRAYTEFTFKGNELVMEIYTNKFNQVEPLELHSRWEATLGDRAAAQEAIAHFDFPKAVMVKDFSHVFKNMSESIYFSTENDPYDSASQPHVGSVTINISIDNNLKVESDHELFILLTTKSLFEGLKYIEDNLKYISKCIYFPVNTKRFTFNNIHPGTYYLYSYNDINNDRRHLSGDHMSSKLDNVFTLLPGGNTTVATTIDFIIP